MLNAQTTSVSEAQRDVGGELLAKAGYVAVPELKDALGAVVRRVLEIVATDCLASPGCAPLASRIG